MLHQTGERDYQRVVDDYRDKGLEGEPVSFIKDMAMAYRFADVVVSRAGATTIFELAALGRPFTQSDVRQQILRRDAIDSGREDSPLRAAEDAIVISTDGLNQEQVVDKIVALVEGKS